MNHTLCSTIDQIKRRNEAAGFYYFSPDTLRFFHSRILESVYHTDTHKNLFITSERYNYEARNPRRYTIRQMRDNGDIMTVGKFQQYSSAAAARSAIKSGRAFS